MLPINKIAAMVLKRTPSISLSAAQASLQTLYGAYLDYKKSLQPKKQSAKQSNPGGTQSSLN